MASRLSSPKPASRLECEAGRPLTGSCDEKLFGQGESQWEHGFCECDQGDALCYALSMCLFVRPCFMAVTSASLLEKLGSSNDVCNFCCGYCHAPYAVGKMAAAQDVHEDVDYNHCCQWLCCYDCQVLRFKAEAKATNCDKGQRDWKQPLLGCCDSPGLAACVCFCPCVPLGHFYHKLGKNPCIYGLCGSCCLEYTRGRVVKSYNINESFADYVLKALCCAPCAACQLFAEVNHQGGAQGGRGGNEMIHYQPSPL